MAVVNRSNKWGLLSLCATIFIVYPLLVPSPYYVHISVLALLYVVLALGLSIVVGFAGLLDLGYVAFYAVGAYSYAILNTLLNIPFGIGILVGGLLATIIGIIIGFPTIRARGDYLALVTLGFGEMIRLLLRNWDSLTNGPRGIMGIDRPSFFSFVASQPIHFYYLVLSITGLTVWFIYRVRISPLGQSFIAIRDDEDAAEAIGINSSRLKLYAFAIGAFFAGIMGTFFAGWQQFVSPESFTLLESIIILSMVILGGMGNIIGTIISALFLVLLPEFLRGFMEYRLLIFGIILVVVVIFQERRKKHLIKKWNQVNSTSLDLTGIELSNPSTSIKIMNSTNQELSIKQLLQCSNLSKHFNGIKALEDVSFQLNNKEILGLIGPNGAGKTTLFNCINGTCSADSGKIFFQEKIIFHRSNSQSLKGYTQQPFDNLRLKPYQTAQMGIARTFQNVRLFSTMTVGQNINSGLYCHQKVVLSSSIFTTKRSIEVRKNELIFIEELLKLFGLISVRDIIVSNLPLAYQRKVEIARALATSPKLLLLDEPASGLNDSEKNEFCRLIVQVQNLIQLSLVIIEHDMNVLMELSDRVICMNRGKIIAEGTPYQIKQNPVVKLIYLGSDEDIPEYQK